MADGMPYPPGGGKITAPLTFDGVTGQVGGCRLVAGAACIWRRPADGRPPVLVRVVTTILPDGSGIGAGEARACQIGLEALLDLTGAPRRVRVAGDNTPVVRYGAAQGRLRWLPMLATLDDGIRAATAGGWTLSWQVIHRSANLVAQGYARGALRDAQRRGGATAADGRVNLILDVPGGHR